MNFIRQNFIDFLPAVMVAIISKKYIILSDVLDKNKYLIFQPEFINNTDR